MPEYARKTGAGPTRSDDRRVRARSTAPAGSTPSAESGARTAHPLHAALNGAPAVQAVAQLRRTLNQNSRVAQSTRPAAAGQAAPGGTVQAIFGTVQRVEDEELLQGKFATAQRVEEEELLQGTFATAQRVEEEEPLQGTFATAQRAAFATPDREEDGDRAPNRTGMPDGLKSAVESLSGMDLSDVRVHPNSDRPAQLNARAYTQGTSIHLGRGEESLMPHELWHVVQQGQGRVSPTMELDGTPINDDRGLEAEADRMGGEASELMRRDASLDRPGT